MFTLKTQNDPTPLEREIESLFAKLSSINPATTEYAATADQLSKLYKLKETDSPKRVSPDTLATVAGNILGIVLILNFERTGIVLSKAVNFVLKPR